MRKVIVFGIDAFDPKFSEELMRQGELAHFSEIKNSGSYERLETSNPAQSPVAWSSIATGANPGRHGLFDFISRNPQDYLPRLATLRPNARNILGQRSSMFNPVRQGLPFWAIASQNGVPTTVLKWPATFPPEKVTANMLSGLGVPDIRNTLGRYTLYTTSDVEQKDRRGDVINLPAGNNIIETFIIGPNKIKLPIKILTNPKGDGLILKIGDKNHLLKERAWSDWIDLKFHLGFGKSFSGIGKFFLVSLKPKINLYLSSIHVDPRNPVFIISFPDSYARDLASHIGVYHTLGLPGETNGLNDNCLSEEAFLQLVEDLLREREKMLWHELNKFREGIFAFVFDTIDCLQHFFWGNQEIMEIYYRRMDEILGKIMRTTDKDTLLMVVSDHGFTSFQRAIHLNSWLRRQGLLTLKNPVVGEPLLENVDWGKTKAYALGFSSIYLNLRGREKEGIVEPGGEAETLKRDIATALLQLRDPKTEKPIMNNVYKSSEIYSGSYLADAPDLIVGTKPGYRVSWQTALGAAPEEIFEDNLTKWNSDHLCDPVYVPGILFINQKISRLSPSVLDVAPTILKYFQMPKSPEMEGDALI